MEFRSLGNTDIKVSAICLGTMTWGEQNSEKEAHQQLDYALERGINFFDTAEMYPVPPKGETYSLTEQYIGTWQGLKKKRDQLILATKIAGPGMQHIRGGSKFNRAHIEEAVNASLQRLQVDYIDLYQLHWPERNTNFFGKLGYQQQEERGVTSILETLEALKAIEKSGKVRSFGLSNETAWGAMSYLKYSELHNLPRMVSIQNPYNLLNRSFEVGLAEVAHREGLGLLAYSPLGFGVLTGKFLNGQMPANTRIAKWSRFSRYSNEQGSKAVAEYVRLAHEHGISPTQMALSFVISRPFLTSNIIGATTMEQLKENIDSVELRLTDEVLSGIESIHKQFTNPCP